MLPEVEFHKLSYMSVLDKLTAWVSEPDNDEEINLLGLCLPPELMGVGYSSQLFSDCSSLRKNKKIELSQDELKEYSDKFYNIVLDAIKGDNRKLSNYKFESRELEAIVESLQKAGFKVSDKDSDDIIKVAKTIRNGKITAFKSLMNPDRQYRHASLNCYDYDRLKEEMERLADDIGYKNIDREAPTLSRIYVEAVKGEKELYPGRHLPFDKIKGRTAWRYQCLRIMDEILCTSDERMTNDRMRQEIIIKVEQYGIHRENDIIVTDSSLKKLYAILSELINVEHTWGKKIKYDSNVYVDGRAGHLYKEFKDGRRLSAFAVDISGLEAWNLRKEIGMMRVKYFNDDIAYFRKKFPLLSMLGYLDNLLLDEENMNTDINNVSHTDFVTVNYRHAEYSDLKQKVEGTISMHLPIFVNIDSKVEKIIPVTIRENRGKWVLIAKNAVSLLPCIITSEQLSQSFDIDSNYINDDDSSPFCDHIIGIAPLLKPELIDVTLEVTEEGLEDIFKKDSVFRRMKPKVEYKVSSYTGQKYIRGSRVSFSLYINEDFLRELFSLDCKAMLLTIMPDEVNEMYERYYEMQMGSKRQHPQDRPQSMKRLKKRKNME